MPAVVSLILFVVFAGAATIIVAWTLLTAQLPRMNRWGATDAELARSLPGDDLVVQPTRVVVLPEPDEEASGGGVHLF